MSYISREAAIEFIDAGHLVSGNEPRWSDNEVVNFLKSRPAADVVEVVRCKDCIYFDKDYDEDTADWCHAWSETTREDGYCHNAERGEQE